MCVLGKNTFVVNSPSRPLWIDTNRNVYPLTIRPPAAAPVLTATGSGSLTGVYLVTCTFKVKDPITKATLYESDFGPTSAASAALAAQLLVANGVPLSADSCVNARGLYRTTAGGSTFYPWIDIDDNSSDSVTDGLADDSLSLVAAPTDLGVAPNYLEIIQPWKNRLWGRTSVELDDLRWSSNGKFYAWPADNSIPIPPKGKDQVGITAIVPRRDELVVSRLDSLHKITGTEEANFTRSGVAEGYGILSHESVQVIRDQLIFLGNPPGIYTYGSGGLACVSDAKVKSWFSTDTYFNRGQFVNAFSRYDPVGNTYQLFLAATGGTTINRWIEWNIDDDTWWGPHLTSEFTPTCGSQLNDSNDVLLPVIGSSNGFLWKDNAGSYVDGASTAVAMLVDTPFWSANTPDIEKVWLEPTIISKIQGSGTLTITPKVGSLAASAGTAISHTLTLGRERLRRLGQGRFVQLNLSQATGVGCEIYGIELPFFEVGRR